jgi:hypothetical protein
VTDSRVGSLRRGAGAALVRGIRDYGRSRQKKALWVDSWAGKRLVKYVYVPFICSLLSMIVGNIDDSLTDTMKSKASMRSASGVIQGSTRRLG